jgi:hypothetical protein
MCAEVLPLLRLGKVVPDGRDYLMEQGRCMLERRVWATDEWWEGLRLHIEVGCCS